MWFLFGAVTTVAAAGFVSYRSYAASWSGKKARGFEYDFDHDKYGHITKAKAGVDHLSKVDFELKRETGTDRWFKGTGLSVEQQVGDAAFDNALYLSSDDPTVRRMFTECEALRTAAFSLFFGERDQRATTVNRVVCRAGRVWAEFKPGSDMKDDAALTYAQVVLAPHLQGIARELNDRRLQPRIGRDPLLLKSVLVLAASSGLAINGAIQLFRLAVASAVPYTVDAKLLFSASLIAGLALLLGVCAVAFKLLAHTSRLHLVLVEVLLIGSFGAWATCYTELRDANMEFDHGAPTTYSTVVVNKWIQHGKHTTYKLCLRDWNGQGTVTLNVSSGQYDATSLEQQMQVTQRAGAFGMRWVERIE